MIRYRIFAKGDLIRLLSVQQDYGASTYSINLGYGNCYQASEILHRKNASELLSMGVNSVTKDKWYHNLSKEATEKLLLKFRKSADRAEFESVRFVDDHGSVRLS